MHHHFIDSLPSLLMPAYPKSFSKYLACLIGPTEMYVVKERREGREPIFDFEGIMLQPPIPGPYAGELYDSFVQFILLVQARVMIRFLERRAQDF